MCHPVPPKIVACAAHHRSRVVSCRAHYNLVVSCPCQPGPIDTSRHEGGDSCSFKVDDVGLGAFVLITCNFTSISL